jgi:hypothetical protein
MNLLKFKIFKIYFFFFLGKYSEPLKSLLDQLSEKLSNSSTKRPTSHEPIDVNNKRNAPMSK